MTPMHRLLFYDMGVRMKYAIWQRRYAYASSSFRYSLLDTFAVLS